MIKNNDKLMFLREILYDNFVMVFYCEIILGEEGCYFCCYLFWGFFFCCGIWYIKSFFYDLYIKYNIEDD